MTLAEPIAVAIEIATALEKLGIRHVLGGSLASSVHGIPRATQDIDLLIELPGRLVDALVEELEPSFYVDRDMVIDAVQRRASFNVIHTRTLFKVDLFVSDRRPLLVEEMERAETFDLGEPAKSIRVCSAEDIVVQKLNWYELGNRVSERQWKDLVGVLEVRRGRLDLDYIRRWGLALGLTDLVERALEETQSHQG